MIKLLKTCFLLFIASVALAQSYKFVSGPQGGNWFVLGGAISSYFTEDGIETTSSTGGGVGNIININDRKADVGFSVGSLLSAGIKAEGNFQREIDNVVLLANLYPQVTYFVARTDFVEKNGIKTLGDALRIKNLRITSLKPGTASEFVISSLLKMYYETDWKKIRSDGGKVQFASYSDGANLIADNNTDIFAFSVGEVASVILNMESQSDITILPIEQEGIDKIAQTYGTKSYRIKPGVYKSVKSEIPTIVDYTVAVVRKDLDPAVVEAMSKSLVKHKKQLAETVKDFDTFSPATAISDSLPMHPVSRTYFESLKN